MSDIDSASISDDISGSSSVPGADNADAGSTQVDTPQSDPSVGTSAEAGSAVADNPTVDGQQPSLAADTETNKTVGVAQAPQYGEKQYKEVQGWATKLSQRNAELAAELKQLKSQLQERAQQEQQPKSQPWDPEDPRHQDFLKLVDKADFYDEQMRGETDEAFITKLRQKQIASLGDEGVKLLQQWQQSVRAQERERRLNPQAFYRKLIRQESQPVVRETLQATNESYQRQVQAVNDVQQWMQQSDIATPDNKQAVIDLMEKGMPFDIAKTAVEREHYRKLVSEAKKASASAGEKERLLQGNAAGVISRNPNASKRVDVAALRKEKGIQDGRQLTDMLFDLDKQGLL